MTTRAQQLEARRVREARIRSRLQEESVHNQAIVDAIREVLGLAPLYGDPYRTELERFYRTRPWRFTNGMRPRPMTDSQGKGDLFA